jgi:hypothetical protein
MATTTGYGTWNNRVAASDLTVEQSVSVSLGDYYNDYDVDAIVSDYRTAINEALPQGVSLCGDEFIGPYSADDATWNAELDDEDSRLDIKAIVEGVDFWKIAAKHDKTV